MHPHWTPNAHWTKSNPVWAHPHWMHIHPIQISPNPLPEMVSIRIGLDLAIACHAWGLKRAWHACVCRLSIGSVLLRATHCVPHTCIFYSSREAICWLAEVQIWWGRHGSCVEVWPLEVNMHAWICSTHKSLWTRLMYIGFALNSHWAKRLLNWFESRFSVDRP